jgi:hypothetical protein
MSGRKDYLPSTEFGGLLAAGTRVIVDLGLIAFSRGFIASKRRLLAQWTIRQGIRSSPLAPESIRAT